MQTILSDGSKLLKLSEIGPYTPSRKQPSYSTVYHWQHRGVSGARLKTVKLGKYRFTSEKALADFFEEQARNTSL